jgi:hypothetical protein
MCRVGLEALYLIKMMKEFGILSPWAFSFTVNDHLDAKWCITCMAHDTGGCYFNHHCY